MKLVNTALHFVKRNSPTILSSAAVAGVVSTSYLTGKATFKASRVIYTVEEYRDVPMNKKELVKERAVLVWKLYIPAAASGAVTIGCIVGANHIGNKRAVAAQAAFILTERAYSEYRDKVVEEYGEKADQKIREKIAEDRIRDNPPSEILIAGPGNVLCYEKFTGRYFASDIETLRKAQNELNAQLLHHDQCSMEEWYNMIGLGATTNSSSMGWNSDKLMELHFSSVLSEDGRPCLAFDYNYWRSLYDGICP